MSAIKNLDQLIATMSPVLDQKSYVFVSLRKAKLAEVIDLNPLSSHHEKEGLSLIIEEEVALKNNLTFEAVFQAITLNVHSSLEAVGLTATVSCALAQQGISANVIAAAYHDHIFVQKDNAQKALKILTDLQKNSSK